MCDEKVMPKGTDALVVALCADYFRRKRLIEHRTASHTVIMECRYLNYRIFDAAASVVGTGYAERFIRDIGECEGYGRGEDIYMSETVYKIRKGEVKRAIAKRLSLF